MKPLLINPKQSPASGFSVFELLIVVAMVSVVTGFALLQIAGARQEMIRTNATQQFAAFLEKARLDSLRRHPVASAQMAQVQIVNATFYSVTIDSDGDGTLDPPRIFGFPANSGLQFNVPFPRTIYFNPRGRTVDVNGNIATPDVVTITDATGRTNSINLTSSGEPSLHGAPTSSPVTNSNPGTTTFRNNTYVQHP